MNPQKRADRIHALLTEAFNPIALDIKDESAKHAGHAGARAGGESHFDVRIVSDAFMGLTKVARHRAVYAALAGEMAPDGIHALALHTLAPDEI